MNKEQKFLLFSESVLSPVIVKQLNDKVEICLGGDFSSLVSANIPHSTLLRGVYYYGKVAESVKCDLLELAVKMNFRVWFEGEYRSEHHIRPQRLPLGLED